MKTKKNELLFYLSYICLYISLFIGDIYSVWKLADIAKAIRLISYGMIFISIFYFKLKAKDMIKLILIFFITFVYGFLTGDLYWSILILLDYSSKRINIKTIFSISSKIIIVGIIAVLFLCLIDVLPDIITARDSAKTINYVRHSFGFYHSNVLPLLLLYLEIYYIFIKNKKYDFKIIIFFAIVAILLNIMCNSRNAFILSSFLSISILYEKFVGFRKSFTKIVYIVAKISIPIMAVFSYAMLFLLLKGGIWSTIDSVFSGRFRLAIFKMQRIGLHLINFMSNEDFINDNINYVNGKLLDTVVLDNGYLYVIFRYGILIILFYFMVAFLLSEKVKENINLLITLCVVFFANFVDNDLVDYSFLPFILWAFNDLSFDGIADKMKIKMSKNIVIKVGGKKI